MWQIGIFTLLFIFQGLGVSTSLGEYTIRISSVKDQETGQRIYQERCLECHGPTGRGDGPRAPLLAPSPGSLVSAAISSKTDQELLKIISEGVPRTAMRGWKEHLSENELLLVLKFIRTLIRFQEPSLTPPPPADLVD